MGFTLSELLIALSILGLIATFTVPKVMTHMTWSANKTKLKSHIAAIHEALNAAELEGSYTTAEDVLKAKLNYTHFCPRNNVAGACAKAYCSQATPYTNYPRIIMHDGSIILIYDEVNNIPYTNFEVKVEQDKDANFSTNGRGNSLWVSYNPKIVTEPANAWFPETPPGMMRSSISSTALYNLVFK
jgi:prepilin-type N-terminal cleavage/methylation domain-containing protein